MHIICHNLHRMIHLPKKSDRFKNKTLNVVLLFIIHTGESAPTTHINDTTHSLIQEILCETLSGG